MEGNGHIEVEVGAGKTTYRRCKNRLEVAVIDSLLGELGEANASYQKLRGQYQQMIDDEKAPPLKRNEAFEAKADLENRFTTRAIPLANRVLGELTKRLEAGVSPDEYGLADTLNAGAKYVGAHKLEGAERKNSSGGPESSSPVHPAS